jgi:Tol biopolymer transport system component
MNLRLRIKLLAGVAALMLMPVALMAQERIAYNSFASGNADIWSMRTDGSDPRQLTTNTAGDGDPSFSPDGSRIAFVSSRDGNNEIYVMNADGTNQKRLTSNTVIDQDPSWSPDGSKIIFVSFRDTSADVFTMNADGSNPVNLTKYPGGNETEPVFSPDGKKVAFRALRDGHIEIYIMNDDGTEQTPLTDSSGIDTEPAFSPDGSKIVFRSDRDAGDREIYIMDVDGSNEVNLTHTPGVTEIAPSFSPDGSKIIFYDTANQVLVMDPNGANRDRIGTVEGSEPSWGAENSVPVLSDVAITSDVDEGSFATLTLKISDPDENDSFTLGVQWDSTQVTQLIEVPAGTRTFEFMHKYTDDKPDGTASDTYPVKVSIDDHRFGKASAETQVTVNNVDPILTGFAITPSPVVLGGTVKLSGTVEDPGYISDIADEALRVSLDWGDGSTEIMDLFMPGPINPPQHKYAALGTYHVTVKVTDNDSGETVQMFDVVVSPPPPPAAPSGLRVDFIAADRIQIVWTDNSNNEDGFIIESCQQRGCNNFIEVGRVFPDINHFVHGNLFSNTQYYYRVRAFNTGGKSAYTDVVSAKTLRK